MKAERRHELQTNSLFLWLRWRGPEVWQKHGTKILLALVVVMLAWILIKRKLEAPKEARRLASTELNIARESLRRFQLRELSPGETTEIRNRLQHAYDTGEDAGIQSAAMVTLGDYYLAHYNQGEYSGSTRPDRYTEGKPPEVLDKAERAFKQATAVKDAPANSLLSAKMGLAYVTEERAFQETRAANYRTLSPRWEEARKMYEAIAADTNVSILQRDQARWQVEQIAQRQKPLWFAPPSTRPLVNLSLPLGPEMPPGTRPATQPTAIETPGTAPATKPATRGN